MSCGEAEPLVVEAYFGALAPQQAWDLLRHLWDCMQCRELSAALLLLRSVERVVKSNYQAGPSEAFPVPCPAPLSAWLCDRTCWRISRHGS
jgi:hypothetical protein